MKPRRNPMAAPMGQDSRAIHEFNGVTDADFGPLTLGRLSSAKVLLKTDETCVGCRTPIFSNRTAVIDPSVLAFPSRLFAKANS